nr:transposase, MuDR, MULE transposase domain protein [Tanacetum cinerariifolium]
MYDMAKTYWLIDLYITHIPKNIAEYYYKNLSFNVSHEEVTSKVKTHEKHKRDARSMSSEELVAWVLPYLLALAYHTESNLKDFLHLPGNCSASFSSKPKDVPISVGSPAGSVANVPNKELEMAVLASVANNAVGAEGKRVAFLNSIGSPSFKKIKHVVLDEAPSSPKFVPDNAPSDEACKTLFGSLASTEYPGDSDPFLVVLRRLVLPMMLFATSPISMSNVVLMALSAEIFRLHGEVEALKDKLDFANKERTSLEEAMLGGRSQALRGWLAR